MTLQSKMTIESLRRQQRIRGLITLFSAIAIVGCGGGNNAPAVSPPIVVPPPPPPPNGDPQPIGVAGHPNFMSPHSTPIAISGEHVFVVNTPADTVDVISTLTRTIVARINVGIDPVSVAVRPDGSEVWVANHVSDAVSVIDIDVDSPTHLQVIATIQDFDAQTRATLFDEPVGIAFADNNKAYVALSAENQVAVINVLTREIEKRLAISAHDPRAIIVRNGRLFVIPFESNNRTQISGCVGPPDGDVCTFDAFQHVVTTNNVLSTFIDVDIVKHARFPDRDLFVFDTTTDQLIDVVEGVGTLLYGLAIDSRGRVFVAQTDARNDANGRAGTQKHGLAEMDNRAFLNRITTIDCSGSNCAAPGFIDLEPLPPTHPLPGDALATPFAIQISGDDSTIVATAAGSGKLFTVDAITGERLGTIDVGAVPRGVELVSTPNGQLLQAWVLNAVSNSVSVVDLADTANPGLVATIALDDPTHPVVKRGRIAFHDAGASTTGTYSCESCHPDGHTDQLVWVLDTPVCSVAGCTQIPPRTTMPIRGLRDTAPYHWDGIPGDPYGGNNTANIFGSDAPNCSADQPASCTRFLVDGGLATTMCMVGNCPVNEEGKPGALTAIERDAMATFLLSVPYPPAQRRSFTNVLSNTAANGFRVFHIDGTLRSGTTPNVPNVCGDCHRMPFWVSTNNPGTGMDAPTFRGAYDRWLILPQGRANVFDLLRPSELASTIEERTLFLGAARGDPLFDPVWNMILEGSTGFSGAFSRSVTINKSLQSDAQAIDLLAALEKSAGEGGVLLQGEGVFIDGDQVMPVTLQFDGQFQGGVYVDRDDITVTFTRGELITRATAGEFLGTVTARVGEKSDLDHPQPAIWSLGPIEAQRGRQQFPTLTVANPSMVISGRHILADNRLVVDGEQVSGSVNCQTGALPNCTSDAIEVLLDNMPRSQGMHFLQIQNTNGLFSNDFIFMTQ